MSEMVTVFDRSFSSPHALAASLAMKLPAIYVYGSDCWRNASTSRIDDNHLVIGWEVQQSSGQTCRFVSSTRIRSSLLEHEIPECYGRFTKEYLATVFLPEPFPEIEEEPMPAIQSTPEVHEESVYTEDDPWPEVVEEEAIAEEDNLDEEFFDAFDGLPPSPVLHDCFGTFAPDLGMDHLATDSCAASATAVDIEAKVSFACNAEVMEYPEFHDMPGQQETPGICSTYLSLSAEHIEQAAAHADWYMPNWRRWLRRPATPSYYTRDDDPAQAHRVWSETVLAGPSGPGGSGPYKELCSCSASQDSHFVSMHCALPTFAFAHGPLLQPLPLADLAAHTFEIELKGAPRMAHCWGAFDTSKLAKQLADDLRGPLLQGSHRALVAAVHVCDAPSPNHRPGVSSSSRQSQSQELPANLLDATIEDTVHTPPREKRKDDLLALPLVAQPKKTKKSGSFQLRWAHRSKSDSELDTMAEQFRALNALPDRNGKHVVQGLALCCARCGLPDGAARALTIRLGGVQGRDCNPKLIP
eukprot:4302819-Amphidinium_carterae.1